MAHPILMPKPGQMTEECTIVAWHKKPGDPVSRGDILFEIETDKSNMDVEAFDEGVLLKTYVDAGQTVPVNSVVAYVGNAGEQVPEAAPEATDSMAPAAAPAAAAPAAETTASAAVPATAAARSDSAREGRIRISPRASRLAASAGIDPRTITGTGPEGRITERDVVAASSKPAAAAPMASSPAPAPAALPPAVAQPIYVSDPENDAPRPMTTMRRIIGERLTFSATTVPQFTVTVAVEMTRLLALRAELKSAGTALTITDFIVSAVAHTLAEFPDVNARTDGVSVWHRRRVHVGLAVSIPDGLVVPVIRDADRRSIAELHALAARLADAARSGTLTPDDMSGGTFTISNLGMFGVDEFSAIINPGESAILAVSSIVPTPVVVGEGVGIRHIIKLTMTADHRLVDGELAARFLNALRRRLQDADAYRSELLNS
jgi:pyruvate dehydrogenase E2 component (dihydrolipoamide acetyltransferase)